MIYSKWFLLFVIDKILLIFSIPLYPILCLFTANGWPKWGSIWWTYDNQPQGDEGFQKKRAPYLKASTPWQLYVNRIAWLFRNPNYGFNKKCAIGWGSGLGVIVKSKGGDGLNISDKYKRSGWYFVECINPFGDVIGFEFYGVFPYSKNRDIRIRLGWKIMTDKFHDIGFAPFVGIINPFDYYGNE